ncbi:MAG: VOC family protein [Alphaproteobacteria bacterium]|nr:VOC family protein [Alphaproteobacteria bacterium]
MSDTKTFVWYELLTNDPTTARAFYTELLPWTAKDSEQMPGYTMINVSGTDDVVGGLMELGEDMAKMGAPNHWALYINCDDVDAACKRAEKARGKILMAPFDIPGIGRTAIISDPQGGVFSPFKGAEDMPAVPRPPDHTFCWSQVMTKDVKAAAEFYNAVFGWDAEPMPQGVVFKEGERMVASAMPLPEGAQAPAHWLNYVAVPDVDAVYAKAAELGATRYHAPTDMPGMGRFAVLADPTGATFALWTDASAQG